MKIRLWLLLLLLLFSASVCFGGAPEISPYAPLSFLVGGVWSAGLPPDKFGNDLRIDLRCEWAGNRQGIRFESAFVRRGKAAPYSSGMYVWDPVKSKLTIIYTDDEGALTQEVLTEAGGVLVHDLTVANKDGTVDVVHTKLTKLGEDTFTNEISIKKGGDWQKIAAPRYERHPEPPAAAEGSK